MPGPFHPEGLHSSGTALVHCQAVGEVDDLILGAVDDQHGGGDLGYLVNAAERKGRDRTPLLVSQITHSASCWGTMVPGNEGDAGRGSLIFPVIHLKKQ